MRTLTNDLNALLQHLRLHGVRLPFPTAMVISGAAFRHYFFNPDYNHAWLVEYPDDHWREDTLFLENYGLYEAVEGHTGWTSRRWQNLKGPELVQLLRYEHEAGRVLRQDATWDTPAGFIQEFHVDRNGLALEIEHDGTREKLAHQDLSTLDEFSNQLGVLQSLRPVAGDIPDRRRHALTQDVFRWASRHWNARKELLYDVQAFYAAGNQAWIDLQAFAESLDRFEGEKRQRAQDYIQNHLHELQRARNAAAQFFAQHDDVANQSGFDALDARSTEQLAAAWKAAAAAIDHAAHTNTAEQSDAIAAAHTADRAAFEHFDAWTRALQRVTTSPN